MKHLCKKALSLLLAVLMVVSVLPMNVLAASFVDSEDGAGRREEAVIDGSDPIVDTQAGLSTGGEDSGSRPEIPGGGGDGSADPGSATNVTIERGDGDVFLQGTMTGADSLVLLVVPRFNAEDGDSIADAIGTDGPTIRESWFTTIQPETWPGMMTSNGVTLPGVMFIWENINNSPNVVTYELSKDGVFTADNRTGEYIQEAPESPKYGTMESMISELKTLVDEHGDKLYTGMGQKWDSSTNTLPFRAYAITGDPLAYIDFDLPVTDGGPTIRVDVTPESVGVMGTLSIANAAAPGVAQFATATVTNTSDVTLYDIKVTLTPEEVKKKPDTVTASNRAPIIINNYKSSGNYSEGITAEPTTQTIDQLEPGKSQTFPIYKATSMSTATWTAQAGGDTYTYKVEAKGYTEDGELGETASHSKEASMSLIDGIKTMYFQLMRKEGNGERKLYSDELNQFASVQIKQLGLASTQNADSLGNGLYQVSANGPRLVVLNGLTGEGFILDPTTHTDQVDSPLKVYVTELTVEAVDGGGGTNAPSVTGGGITLSNYEKQSKLIIRGENVDLTASWGTGEFQGWSGDLGSATYPTPSGGTNTLSGVVTDQDRTVTATFAGQTFQGHLIINHNGDTSKGWNGTKTIEIYPIGPDGATDESRGPVAEKDGFVFTNMKETSSGSGEYTISGLVVGTKYAIKVNQQYAYSSPSNTNENYIVLQDSDSDGSQDPAEVRVNVADVEVRWRGAYPDTEGLVLKNGTGPSATDDGWTTTRRKYTHTSPTYTYLTAYAYPENLKLVLTVTRDSSKETLVKLDLNGTIQELATTPSATYDYTCGSAAQVIMAEFGINGIITAYINGAAVAGQTKETIWLHNGSEYIKTGTNLSTSATHKYRFANLPAVNENGEMIQYTIYANGYRTEETFSYEDAGGSGNADKYVYLYTVTVKNDAGGSEQEDGTNTYFTGGDVSEGPYYTGNNTTGDIPAGKSITLHTAEQVTGYTFDATRGWEETQKPTINNAEYEGSIAQNTQRETTYTVTSSTATNNNNHNDGAVLTAHYTEAAATQASAYLDLTLNGEGVTATGPDIIGVKLTKKDGGDYTPIPDAGPTYQGGAWKGEVPRDTLESTYWEVTTSDGGTYYQQVETDGATNSEMKFYGVQIVSTSSGNTGEAPTLQAQAGSDPSGRIVVPLGTTIYELNAKLDSGFTLTGWLGEVGNESPTTALSEVANVDSSGLSNQTTATNAVTLQEGYSASDDLYIKAQVTFDAYFQVTVNGTAITQSDTGTGDKVTAVKLTQGGSDLGTLSEADGKWHATNIPDGSEGSWQVTTVDGATYQAAMTTTSTDGAPTVMALFGVKIVNNAHGNEEPGYQASLSTAQSTGGAHTYVVTQTGQAITLTPNLKDGFTLAGWLGEVGNESPTTALSGVENVTLSGNSLTLTQGSYNETGDLTVMADVTFSAQVTPKYQGTTAAEGVAESLSLRPSGTSGDQDISGTRGGDGTWTFETGLDPAKDYEVWVNGFKSNATVTKDNAGQNVDVTMVKLTAEAQPEGYSDKNKAYIWIGDVEKQTTEIYVPAGADNQGGTPVVHVKAVAGKGHRMASKNTNGADSDTWTLNRAPSAEAQNVTIVNNNVAATEVTLEGVTADHNMIAHFVAQQTVDVEMDPGTKKDSALNAPTVSSGQAARPDGSGNYLGNLVDEGGTITITTAPDAGTQLDYWTVTGGDSRVAVYEGSGTDSPLVAGGDGHYTSKGNTITLKVNTAGEDTITVTAYYKIATYPVQVTVKLDNQAYTDRTVELRQDGATKATLTSEEGDGVYTGEVEAGVYDLFVDGVTTDTVEDTDKDVSVSAPSDTPFGGTQEVNYYTVKVALAGGLSKEQDGVAASLGSNADGGETSRIVLAKGTPQRVDIAATANNHDKEGTNGKHYSFTQWTASPESVTVDGEGKTAVTQFTLPEEDALKSAAEITSGTPITLTAAYQEEYKLTVKNGHIGGGNITTVPAMTGDSAGGGVVYVATGSSVNVTTKPNTGVRLAYWEIDDPAHAELKESGDGGTITPGGDKHYIPTADRNQHTVTLQADATITATWEVDQFEGTIKLEKSDGQPYTVSDREKIRVELVSSEGDSDNRGNQLTTDHGITSTEDGTWTAKGLSANEGTTYRVKINGYLTNQVIKKDDNEKTVTMYEVKVAVKVSNDEGDTTNNAATHQARFRVPDNVVASSYTTDSYFLPAGAGKTGLTTPLTLGLTATKGTGYRFNKDSDGTALWTVTKTSDSDPADGNFGSTDANSANATWSPNAENGLNEDLTITANFTQVYTVTATATSGVGTATPESSEVDKGGFASITATADAAYTPDNQADNKDAAFVKWTTDPGSGQFDDNTSGKLESTTKDTTFYPSQDSTVHASFKALVGEGTLDWKVTTGYAPSAITVKLTNPGEENTGVLTATLGGTNSGAFELKDWTDGTQSLTARDETGITFSVSPKVGQSAETYTAYVEVTDGDVTIQISITMTVTDPETFGAKLETWPDGTKTSDNILSVTLAPEGAGDSTGKVTAAKADTNGEWNVTDLKWDTTYDVYVNGYKTGTRVTNAHEVDGTHAAFQVKDLYTVSFDAAEYKDGYGNVEGTPSFVTVPEAVSGESPVTVKPANDAGGGQSAIVVAGGGKVNLTDGANQNLDGAGAHYRFKEWQHKVAGGELTTPDGKLDAAQYTVGEVMVEATGSNAPIQLHPAYQQQYKVTFAKPVATTTFPDGNTVTVTVTGGTTPSLTEPGETKTANGTDYVMVDAQDSITLSGTPSEFKTGTPVAASDPTPNYYFNQWQNGEDAKVEESYAPTKDETLTPHYYAGPTLTPDTRTYDIAAGAGAELPSYTWTRNNAGEPTKLQYSKHGENSWQDLTSSSDYTTSGDGYTYTLTRDFLTKLEEGQYDIQVVSVTPVGSGTDTSLTAELQITVNKKELTKALIQVQKEDARTLKSDAADDQNKAAYQSHQSEDILTGDLTFNWYYSDSATPETGETKFDSLAPAQTAATGRYGGTLLTGSDGNGTFADHANGAKDGVYTLSGSTVKGKYIFAVVEAKNTGTGAVITNAIPVDYDATVLVNKDGDAIASGEDYAVYLTPAGDGASKTGADLFGAIPATYTSGGNFTTSGSALTGGVTYDVYVNRVEGAAAGTDAFDRAGSVTPAEQAETVNYYSVNAVNTDQKDVEGAGKTIASKPSTVFATAEDSVTVESGKGVLAGTKVNATASSTWNEEENDYGWRWGTTTAEPDTLSDGDYTGDLQNESTATGTGKTDITVSAKTWVGGRLEQRTYKIQGKVKGSGNLSEAKLALSASSYTATASTAGDTITADGADGAGVIFTVPKGTYTLTGTGKTGTSVVGYAEGTAAESPTNIPSLSLTVDSEGNDKFTIFIEEATYQLKVTDTEAPANTAMAADGQTRTATAAWSATYAKYEAKTYTITVSNEGNTPLDVKLVIKKTQGAGPGTEVYGGSADTLVSADSNLKDNENGVTFGGLEKTFNLGIEAGSKSKTFTVTIPTLMDVEKAADYDFVFTSTTYRQGGSTGPNVTYKLDMQLEPLKVTDIAFDQEGAPTTLSATGLKLDDAEPPEGVSVPTTGAGGADVEYQWYAVEYGKTVSFNFSTGALTVDGSVQSALSDGTSENGTKYTIQADDAGKTIYLVAKGKSGNVTQAAITGGTEKPVGYDVPYAGQVTVNNNTDPVRDTSADDYEVWLVVDGKTYTDADAGEKIQLTHQEGNAGVWKSNSTLKPGTTYRVWANTVSGETGESNLKDTGETVTAAQKDATVTYYSVTLGQTTYNNIYTGLKGTDFFDDDSTPDTPTSGATGTTEYTPTATADGITVEDHHWVLAGTQVDLAHPTWEDKDYTLSWQISGGQEQVDGGSKTAQIDSLNANTEVGTVLKLNLYPVQAYVTGTGSVSDITLTSTGQTNANVFSIKTGEGVIMAIGTASTAVQAGRNVTFQVPKGEYTTLGTPSSAAVTLSGYRKPYNEGSLQSDPVSVTVPDDKNFEIALSTTGQKMKVTAGEMDGTASYDGSGAHNVDDLTQQVTLDYNDENRDIQITVTNTSDPAGDVGTPQTIYDVTVSELEVETTDGDSDASTKITVTSNDLSGTPDLIDGDPQTVTITVPKGLKAGTYTVKADFSFKHEDEGDTGAKVSYTLTIVVNPARFTEVTMTNSGSKSYLTGDETLSLESYTTAKNSLTDADLEKSSDYHYDWYVSESGDLDSGSLTWTAGSVTVTGAETVGAQDTELSVSNVIGENEGKYVYLVIYATDSNGKVEQAAISEPIRLGYHGVVKLKVDNVEKNGADDSTGYSAVFTADGESVNGAWTNLGEGKYAFESESYLDPAKIYTAAAKVSNFGQVSDTATVGTVTPDAAEVTAEYFTVTAEAVTKKDYHDSVGEKFEPLPTPGIYYTGVENDLSGQTILKGQSVTAKFADGGASADDGKAWDQDYTLTWQEKIGGAAEATDKGPAVTSTEAVNGQEWTITNTTAIGGRLDQITYTVTGSITGTAGRVASATMTDANSKVYTTAQATGDTINPGEVNQITGNGAPGDTITFVVVKGDYTIRATAASGTTIQSMEWNETGAVAGNTLTGAKVEADGQTFTVNLAASDVRLGVTDDDAEPHTGVSGTSAANYNHDAEHAEVVYYNTWSGDKTLNVSLTNPGNTSLTAKLDLYKTSAANLGSVNWNASNFGSQSGIVSVTSPDGAVTITNELSVDGKPVAPGATGETAVKAATITIAKNAANTDDGVYILRVTSQNGAATGPVVYYVLNLTVEPLPIVGVTATASTGGVPTPGYAPGEGDTVEVTGYQASDDKSLENVTVQTSASTDDVKSAKEAGLTGDDVKFAWFYSKSELTQAEVKAAVNVAGGAITSTTLTKVEDAAQHTLTKDDLNGYLYVVAYAPSETVNASGMAATGKDVSMVSPPIRTQQEVEIRVAVDDAPVTGEEPTQYGVELHNAEGGKVNATWETDHYTAAIDMSKTYSVYAKRYKDDATDSVDAGLKLGAVDGAEQTRAQVDYYTVNYETDIAVVNTYDGFAGYLPAGNAESEKALQEALKVYLGVPSDNVALADKTPVLKGQSVTVEADGQAKNGDTDPKSWEDAKARHTLSTADWTEDGGAEAGIAYPDDNKVTSAGIEVNAANLKDKTFKAQLDQVLFDVKFAVTGTGSLAGATLKVSGGTEGLTGPDRDSAFDGDWAYAQTLSPAVEAGGAVTFAQVPAGSYTIQGVGADGTTVMKYRWNAGTPADAINGPMAVTVGDAPTADNGLDADGNVAQDGGGYKNYIELAVSTYLLQWQDNVQWKATHLGSEPTGADDEFANHDNFSETWVYADKSEGGYYIRLKNVGNAAVSGLTIAQSDDTVPYTVDLENAYRSGAGEISAPESWNADLTQAFTLEPGQSVTIKVTWTNDDTGGSYANVGEYPDDLTASQTEGAPAATIGGKALSEAPYQAKVVITKAAITKLEVSGIDEPKTGETPDTAHDALGGDSLEPDPSVKEPSVTVQWTGDLDEDGTFAPGRVYTADVTFEADDNHSFSKDYQGSYTVKGEDGKTYDVEVEVSEDGSTLTLTVTYPATAPELDVVASGTAQKNAGNIDRLDVTSDSAVDVYYVVLKTSEAAPADASALLNRADKKRLGTSLSGGAHTDGWPLDDVLTENGTEYTVYAVAVPAGTEVDTPEKVAAAAGQISAMASDKLTTAYRVEAKLPTPMEQENTAQISKPGLNVEEKNLHVEYVRAADDRAGAEATEVATGSVELQLTDLHPNYPFSKWEAEPDSGVFTPEKPTLTEGRTVATQSFTPEANTVLTAKFGSEPRLDLTGTLRSHQLATKGYDGNTNLLYTGTEEYGKATNVGTAALTGEVRFIVTSTTTTPEELQAAIAAAGSDDGAQLKSLESKYFDWMRGDAHDTYVLTANGGWAEIHLYPGTIDGGAISASSNGVGAKPEDPGYNRLSAYWAELHQEDADVDFEEKDGVGVGTYYGTLWAYDSEDGSVYDSLPVNVEIVDTGFVGVPVDKTWDLNPLHPRDDVSNDKWEMDIDAAGYETDEKQTLHISAFQDGDGAESYTWADGVEVAKQKAYTYVKPLSASDPDQRTFTYKNVQEADGADKTHKQILDNLPWELTRADGGKIPVTRGDDLKFRLTLFNGDGNSAYKTLTIHYIDTRPDVNVRLNTSSVQSGNSLTAIVSRTNHDEYISTAPTYGTLDNSAYATYYGGKSDQYDVKVTWYRVSAADQATLGGISTQSDLKSWLEGNAKIVQQSGNTAVNAGSEAMNDSKVLAYTATDEDKGSYLYVVIEGDNIHYVDGATTVAGPAYVGTTVTLRMLRTGTRESDLTSGSFRVTGTFQGQSFYSPNSKLITVGGASLALSTPRQNNDSAPTYYFTGWSAKDGSDGDIGVFSDQTNTGEFRTAGYLPAGDATVTAWYDLLPTLSANQTYDLQAADVETNRQFTYTQHDGSGEVSIVVSVTGDGTFKDGTTAPKTLTDGDFTKSDGSGIDDAATYTITEKWIRDNLTLNGLGDNVYTVTFVDQTKDTTDSTEDDVYSPSVTLTVTAGEVTVYVRSQDNDPSTTTADDKTTDYRGDVSIRSNNSDAAKSTNIKGDTDGAVTAQVSDTVSVTKGQAGRVTLTATPFDGYRFAKWVVMDGDREVELTDAAIAQYGTFDSSSVTWGVASATFTPARADVVIEARFEVAPFEVKVPGDPAQPDDPSGDKDPSGDPTPSTDPNAALAKVYYGDDAFDAAAGSLVIRGDADSVQSFTVAIADPDDAADKAAMTALGATDDVLAKMKAATAGDDAWFALSGQTSGLTGGQTIGVQIAAGKAAKGVHVEKLDGADVTNELTVYLKVTEVNSGAARYVPYAVDVMTTPVSITGITGNKLTDGQAFLDAYRADGHDGLFPNHGDPVDMKYFTFTNILSEKNAADVVSATNNAGGVAENGVVENGVWTVRPTTYNGLGAEVGTGRQNTNDYVFTFAYKPDVPAEKWDYEGESATIAFPVNAPDLALTFSDSLGKAHGEADDAQLKIGLGSAYSEPYTPDPEGYAHTAMGDSAETYRKGEHITYLDTEPAYTVTLTGIGDIYGVKVESDLKGFTVADGELSFPDGRFLNSDEPKTFVLELTTLDGKNLWVGEHTAKFTVTGYSSEAAASADSTRAAPQVTATYEITFTVARKTIAQANVTDLTDPAPGETPDVTVTVEAKDPEGKDVTDPDKHGNTPVVPTVEWTGPDGKPVDPATPFEAGKDYDATVTLTPDPNYQFEQETKPDDPSEPTNEPNYTLDGKGDKDWPEPKGDPELTTEWTPEGTVEFRKPVSLPANALLMFEDVNADDAADKVDPAVTAVRPTIQVRKGEKLGKYTIKLGAYGNTVTGVTVSETGKDLPAGSVWTLAPTDLGDMAQGEANKQSYTLDLTGVDTAKLQVGHTYTLVLKAVGTDPYGQSVSSTYTVTILVEKAASAVLKFDDQRTTGSYSTDQSTDQFAVSYERSISVRTGTTLGTYDIWLSAFDNDAYGVHIDVDDSRFDVVYTLTTDCDLITAQEDLSKSDGDRAQARLQGKLLQLDLSQMDTGAAGTYTLVLTAKGRDINGDQITATYTLTIRLNRYTPGGGGGGGGGDESCPSQVTFLLGLYGTTEDATMEMVNPNNKVKTVPTVSAVEGYRFLGWSLTGPTGDPDADAKRELVDPKSVTITKDTVFYAVYQPLYTLPERPFHENYVIGYPNGNFGPGDNIDRASVATIIARAALPNFVEGADYGNPGGYSDVNGNWAASAIAYCSKYGVFNGYEDGTFRPNQPISRQELALVMARLSGVLSGTAPFTDMDEAGDWAKDGIYTAYAKGWVNGYTDGTFKPLNPIRRDETVKIFNAFLGRGVDAEGLSALTEYVHSGLASNNTENGTSEYMTWPDVTADQWAYYEIIEAANDHEYAVDETAPKGYTVPEVWTKCWIDEKWRYHDDANLGGPSVVTSAVWNKRGLAD